MLYADVSEQFVFHLHRRIGVKKILHTYPPMKMGTVCLETSAYNIQTPGNYPEESIQHSKQGESFKSRSPDIRVSTRALLYGVLIFRWTKIPGVLSSPWSEARHSFPVATLRDHTPADTKNPVWNVTPCDLVESALVSALQHYSARKLEATIS
jgi:hypothetical protein